MASLLLLQVFLLLKKKILLYSLSTKRSAIIFFGGAVVAGVCFASSTIFLKKNLVFSSPLLTLAAMAACFPWAAAGPLLRQEAAAALAHAWEGRRRDPSGARPGRGRCGPRVRGEGSSPLGRRGPCWEGQEDGSGPSRTGSLAGQGAGKL